MSISPPKLRRLRHVHLVGIGGTGMAGIAEVLLTQGYTVSGSDIKTSALTERLAGLGATIYGDHQPENIQSAQAIVVSTAVNEDNPEVIAAQAKRLPIVPRAEMLAELMRFHFGIAVAGTHGKTTTTSLVASLLAAGDLDPTFVIGGLLNSAGSNAGIGNSHYFVAEADESDASFLYLKPSIAIVTNIDADHMETYDHDFAKLTDTFRRFLHHLPFYGLAALCIDDPVVRELLPKIHRPVVTYGFSDDADIRAVDFSQQGTVCQFTIASYTYQLNLPGKHNVLNALAAIAVARELGISEAIIASALQQFAGIGRRFQVHGEQRLGQGRYLLVEDYAHHPCAVAATLQAARDAWPERRLVLAYQPHRYSRTQDCWQDFIAVLRGADKLCLLPIFAAGEKAIDGINSKNLLKAIETDGSLVADETDLALHLQDNDVLLMLGAGSIGSMVNQLVGDTTQ